LGTGECVCECTYKPSEVYTAPKVVDPESARHKGLIHPGANAGSPSEEGARRSPGRKKFVRALRGDPASTKLQGSAACGCVGSMSAFVAEVPNLSLEWVRHTRGLLGLATKQSPYAKHMWKAIGSPTETRGGSFRDSCNKLRRSSSRYEARGLAFYFVACCYRAINSGPHTLCMPTLLGDSLSMTLVFCVLFTRIEEKEEEENEKEKEERGDKGRERSPVMVPDYLQ
ncbi:hypothetical protein ALC60_08289, partial [Trachymyrmex zeteki]